MKQKQIKIRNFVQMHVQEFNKPKVFKDRKKEFKKGNFKYKRSSYEDLCCFNANQTFLW